MPSRPHLLVVDSSRLQYEHIFFNCGLYEYLLGAQNHSTYSVLCSHKTLQNYSNIYSSYLEFAFHLDEKRFHAVSIFHSYFQKLYHFLFYLVRGSQFCFPNPGFDDFFLVTIAAIFFRRPCWIFLHGRITEKLINSAHHPFKRIFQGTLCLMITIVARTKHVTFVTLTSNDIYLASPFLRLLKCRKYIGHRVPSLWREFVLKHYNITFKIAVSPRMTSVVFPGAFVESRGRQSFIDLALAYRNYSKPTVNFKILGSSQDLQHLSLKLVNSGITSLSNTDYIEPQIFYSELMHASLAFFCPDNKEYAYRASGVLLECIAFGNPILSPHTPITDLYCNHYGLPILFYRSICEACEIIETVLTNPRFRESLVNKLRLSQALLSSADFYNNSNL